jgi:YrbI family 3-deoxy-D-manno-octulosonate 8-phosphate phosphatase
LVELIIFDFDGVFTDNTVYVDGTGREFVRCWRSDGLGLSRLREVGVKIFIVSTEKNRVVGARAGKLNTDFVQGVDDKREAVLRIAGNLGISIERTMFVGNDINDIPALEEVGFPVAVADAYSDILPLVCYQTRAAGGKGAVREVCDMVYWSKSKGSGNAV